MKVHLENYSAALDKLKSDCARADAYHGAKQFQSRLRRAMVAISDRARQPMKLPDNFARL